MNNTASIFDEINNTMTVKYDYVNDKHVVYFGSGSNVRRLIYDTKGDAMTMFDSLLCYTKMKLE